MAPFEALYGKKVQNPIVLESNGEKSSLWTRCFATGRKTSINNKAKREGCTVSTEKLYGHEKKIFGV